MRRRTFLGAVGCASIVSLAGCTEAFEDQMELRVTSFIEPELYKQDEDLVGNRYSYTVENRGETGEVRVEYYYFQNADTPNPDGLAAFGGDEHPEVTLDSAETVTMESGEIRTFEMTMDEDDSRDQMGIFAHPASLGGVVENNADGSGEIEVHLEIDSREHDVEDPDPIETSIGSQDEVRVIFNILILYGAAYEIFPEPV